MITKEDMIAIVHSVIIVIAWLSPFWLDWKIIFICLTFYWIQIIVFRGCIMTNWQFNKKIKHRGDMTMYSYWSERFGYKVNRKKLRFSSDYIMPGIILILTIIYQILLNIPVLIQF